MASVNPAELIEHVKDSPEFHVPVALWQVLPDALKGEHPHAGSIPLPSFELFGYSVQVTRFMVIELFVAVALVAVFVPLAWRIRSGGPPRGRLWNFFEAMLLFIRNEVARPAIGKHEADRFLPFLWTVFFFILGCNLSGLLPWAGSPTGDWGCTLALAVASFAVVIGSGMAHHGVVGYWAGQVPRMELPLVMAVLIKPMVFVIEVLGLLIKHFVLSVRLLANMFAGHLVLAVLLNFIAMAAGLNLVLWSGVATVSVFGSVAISLLELFVAFLQAYIFTFLSALFIGMALHQH